MDESVIETQKAKPKKNSMFMPLLVTIIVSASILLFSITQIPHQEQQTGQVNGPAQVQKTPQVKDTLSKTQTEISEQSIQEVLKTAIKQPGIPNMVNPDGQLTYGDQSVSTWFGENGSATIIYNDDPYTYYLVPHADILKELLQLQNK